MTEPPRDDLNVPYEEWSQHKNKKFRWPSVKYRLGVALIGALVGAVLSLVFSVLGLFVRPLDLHEIVRNAGIVAAMFAALALIENWRR